MILNLVRDALKGNPAQGTLYMRHPAYDARYWWREFNRVSYLGGREYATPARISIEFQEPYATTERSATGQLIYGTQIINLQSLLFRHSREKAWEYENRRKRAHYHNVVRSTVNSLVSHATKKGVTRDDTNTDLNEFWKAVDCERKVDIDSFVRDGLRWVQCVGMMWACVDVDTEGDGKPYVYWISPLDVFDWAVDDEGKLEWVKVFVCAEQKRNIRDAIKPIHRFRIFRRGSVDEIDVDPQSGAESEPKSKPTGLDMVPLVPLFSMRNEEQPFPDAEPLIGDFAKGANSVYNYGSLLNEILYKQTFSWLIIPDKNVDEVQVGTGTVFGYDSQGSAAVPAYISPDPEQARILMEAIGATLEQMKSAMGTGRGRSESSKQQATAEALELENEDKRSILGDICHEAEDFEKRLAAMVLSYKNAAETTTADLPHIQYPQDFDLRALKAEIDEALSMRSLGMSPEIDLALRKMVAGRKFAGMPPDQLGDLLETLKEQEQPAIAVDNANADGQGVKKSPNQPGNAGPPTGGAKKPGVATAAKDAG